jgi:hypothetical protein
MCCKLDDVIFSLDVLCNQCNYVFLFFSGDFSDVEFMFILLYFSISDVFLKSHHLQ